MKIYLFAIILVVENAFNRGWFNIWLESPISWWRSNSFSSSLFDHLQCTCIANFCSQTWVFNVVTSLGRISLLQRLTHFLLEMQMAFQIVIFFNVGPTFTIRKMGYHDRIFMINIRKLVIYHKNVIDTWKNFHTS